MVVAVALAASPADAQLGCLVNVGGEFSCEPAQERCMTSGDCAAGDSCDLSTLRCLTTLREACTPCRLGANCPETFGGFPILSRAMGGRCAYDFPCGAPFAFTEAGPAVSDSLCFLDSDRATPVLFPAGDCDGDGDTNASEVSAMTERCVAVVTSGGLGPNLSHLRLASGLGTGAPGLDVALATPAPFVGIRCDAEQDCPDGAPDSPITGRCVYVTNTMTETYGVCVYSDLDPNRDQLPREDRSCEAAPTPLPTRYGTRAVLQSDDYDSDGIPNADDPEVCQKLDFVAYSGTGLVTDNTRLIDGCGALAEARVVLPDGRCAMPATPTTFGVACTERSDCPIVIAGGRTEVRCVEFPGSGVCVYGGGDVFDDSCASATNFTSCGFEGDGYSAFADGNCDDDMTDNVLDTQVCTAAVVVSDAGVSSDAGAFADADAFTDAAASIRPPPPDVTFGGGGGCTCGVGGRRTGPGSALLALGLLGAVWARRRRSSAS